MNEEPRVQVYPDKQALASAVAERFLSKIVDIIGEFGEAHVVLTGGTMGEASLKAIRNLSPSYEVDWSKIHFWWGDDRWVPAGHQDRNDLLAKNALLDHVPVDPEKVHAMPASDSGMDLEKAAEAYAAEILRAAPSHLTLPSLDIVFLGVGPDGHIASLFPGQDGVREQERLVIPVRNSPKPPPERLSLTLPVINSAARVWLVLAGQDKASALGLALAGASIDEVPAAGARGRRTTITWTDASAAAEVPQSLISPQSYWTAADDVN